MTETDVQHKMHFTFFTLLKWIYFLPFNQSDGRITTKTKSEEEKKGNKIK